MERMNEASWFILIFDSRQQSAASLEALLLCTGTYVHNGSGVVFMHSLPGHVPSHREEDTMMQQSLVWEACSIFLPLLHVTDQCHRDMTIKNKAGLPWPWKEIPRDLLPNLLPNPLPNLLPNLLCLNDSQPLYIPPFRPETCSMSRNGDFIVTRVACWFTRSQLKFRCSLWFVCDFAEAKKSEKTRIYSSTNFLSQCFCLRSQLICCSLLVLAATLKV